MKLEKHYSLKHADKVVGLLRQILAKIPRKMEEVLGSHWLAPDALSLQAWSNGREQGYYVCNYQNERGAVFAQQRNGDAILVIYGNVRQFDVTSNMPDDTLWENNRREFNDDLEAAVFIAEQLLTPNN